MNTLHHTTHSFSWCFYVGIIILVFISQRIISYDYHFKFMVQIDPCLAISIPIHTHTHTHLHTNREEHSAHAQTHNLFND